MRHLWSFLVLCAFALSAAPAAASNARFVALGDVGTGSEVAKRVAGAAREACASRGGCDFGVLLGDNVYDRGIASAEDPLFEERLERVLERVGVPFYAVLGNHDYGAPKELPFLGGLGLDARRAAAQVERGRGEGVFRMPDVFWRIERGPVEIVGIDTTPLYWEDRPGIPDALGLGERRASMTRALKVWDESTTRPWRIALGHHPFLSNGPHGDAGAHEGVLGLFSSGHKLARFLDERVLGRFDAYLAGHDHSLQDLGDVQGTELLISGAGASATPLASRHRARWQAAEPGFLLVEADEEMLAFRFVVVDADGGWRVAHERVVSRPHAIEDRRTLRRASSDERPAPHRGP